LKSKVFHHTGVGWNDEQKIDDNRFQDVTKALNCPAEKEINIIIVDFKEIIDRSGL
jgi:hypothetical protein